MDMTDNGCSNCQHWWALSEDGESGECHRFPPVWVGPESKEKAGGSVALWVFPVVEFYEWCGEFKDCGYEK